METPQSIRFSLIQGEWSSHSPLDAYLHISIQTAQESSCGLQIPNLPDHISAFRLATFPQSPQW